MFLCKDMSGTIPSEKMVISFVAYLCHRLFDLRYFMGKEREGRSNCCCEHYIMWHIIYSAACRLCKCVRVSVSRMFAILNNTLSSIT